MGQRLWQSVVFSLWLACLLVAPVIFAETSPKNPSEVREFLQKALDTKIKTSSTPGAVLLVNTPELGNLTVVSGEANQKAHLPMQKKSFFRVASITKTYMATIVLKLAEQGRIQLDEKAEKYLPKDFPLYLVPNGYEVTVRQLLQMQSGIPNYTEQDSYTDVLERDPHKLWTARQTIELIYNFDPTAVPGSEYEYSNTNYTLLELMIVNVTQRNLASNIHEFILNPLNLSDTYLELAESRPGETGGLITHGYVGKTREEVEDVTDIEDGWGLGDTGVVTTASDLAKFIGALLRDKQLLSPASLDQMMHLGFGDYGLGIYRWVDDSTASTSSKGSDPDEGSTSAPALPKKTYPWKIYTHNGTSSGFQCQYYYIPDLSMTIVILTNNFDTDIIDRLFMEVLDKLTGAPVATTTSIVPEAQIPPIPPSLL